MRRRRTFLIVFVVLVLVLIIGVVALVVLGGGFGGRAVPPPTQVAPEFEVTPEIRTERVVVALQTIPRGMRIPPDAVEIRAWPMDKDFPVDPVYDLADVVGMVASIEIPMHRPVRKKMVKQVYLGDGSEISLAIPKGKVAIAMPVTAMSAVANAVSPNDRVDVLISFSIIDVDEDLQIKLPLFLVGGEDFLSGGQPTGEQLPRLVSQYSVQNALVMGVGLWTGELPDIVAITPGEEPVEEAPSIPVIEDEEPAPPPGPLPDFPALLKVTVVTLAVDPQDALVLKWVWESNAAIHLVLRSANDTEVYAQPEAVSLQYMIDRFQISVPAKLPHAAENQFEYRLITEAEERAQPPQE